MYIPPHTSPWGPELWGRRRLCRWFNGDYRSRKKCLSCDPHGGSPLHAAAGRRFRAADREDGEEVAWCCWHWDDWCRLVMREQSSRRRGGHGENDWWAPVRRRQFFSPVCRRLINWMIHLFVLDHEYTRPSCFYSTVVPFSASHWSLLSEISSASARSRAPWVCLALMRQPCQEK